MKRRKRRRVDPDCVACGGSGFNSNRSGPNSNRALCAPCQVNGEPVPPADPVSAVRNEDGSIAVEGKLHHPCASCQEWFSRGALLEDGEVYRCGYCYRTKRTEPKPQAISDPALEGFI